MDSRNLPSPSRLAAPQRKYVSEMNYTEMNYTEDAMTNEDNTTDVPISNWTLATGTKPGARYVYSPPTRSTARHVVPEAKSSQEPYGASR